MYAYIKNDSVFCISAFPISENENIDGGIEIQYENINDPIWVNGQLIERENKRERVKQAILSSDTISPEILEGEIFRNEELGKLLNQKFCGGNQYKELQIHREVLDIIVPIIVSHYSDEMTQEQLDKIAQAQRLSASVRNILTSL